jgi:hypothetical protein
MNNLTAMNVLLTAERSLSSFDDQDDDGESRATCG